MNRQLALVCSLDGWWSGGGLSSDVADGVRDELGPPRQFGLLKEHLERRNCARGSWVDLLQDQEDFENGVVGIGALVDESSCEHWDRWRAYFSENNPAASPDIKIGCGYEKFCKRWEGWAGVWPKGDDGPGHTPGTPHLWAVEDDVTNWFDVSKGERDAAPQLVPGGGIVEREPLEENRKGVGPHVADCFRGLRLSGRGCRGFPGGKAADPILEGLSFVRWPFIWASGDQGPSRQPDSDGDKQGLLPGPHVVIVWTWVIRLNLKVAPQDEPAN